MGGLINLPSVHTFGHWLEHTIKIEEAVKTIHTGEAAAGEFQLPGCWHIGWLALIGIFLAWLLYSRRYQKLQEMPAAKRPDDPLRPMIGPVFTLLKNKYWVDELYWTVILNPYIAISRFLADVIDWRFWHDWFHDIVIARSFHWLTRVALGSGRPGHHRCDRELAGSRHPGIGWQHAPAPNGLCAQLCTFSVYRCGDYSWLFDHYHSLM